MPLTHQLYPPSRALPCAVVSRCVVAAGAVPDMSSTFVAGSLAAERCMLTQGRTLLLYLDHPETVVVSRDNPSNIRMTFPV